MADVFISYASERRPAAQHLADVLRDHGYSVWFDLSLLSGSDFGFQIERELEAAKVVLVLWCDLSVQSDWVRSEARFAKANGTFAPVRITPCKLPVEFNGDQTSDITGWNGAPRPYEPGPVLSEVARFVGKPAKPNLKALEKAFQDWQKYGGQPLADFALSAPLAARMGAAPRFFGAHATSGAVRTHGRGRGFPARLLLTLFAVVAGALAIGAAGWLAWTRLLGPPFVDARTASVDVEAPIVSAPERLADFALFRECDTCPQMVVLPGGPYSRGSRDGNSDEVPVRTVTVPRFAIARFETTWDEWDACVAAGACSEAPVDDAGGDNGWGKGRRPVIETDWYDARAHALFVNSLAGTSTYRLPSEAEWEYAARAGTQTHYSWGDQDPSCKPIGNNGARFEACGEEGPSPVGSYQRNPFALFDMHGNVWEWTEDCYVNDYAAAPIDGSPNESGGCSARVLRGGAWFSTPPFLRASFRNRADPSYRYQIVGFRLARSLSSARP